MENNLYLTGDPNKKTPSREPVPGLPGQGNEATEQPDPSTGPEIIHIGSAGAFSESEGEIADEQDGGEKDQETPY